MTIEWYMHSRTRTAHLWGKFPKILERWLPTALLEGRDEVLISIDYKRKSILISSRHPKFIWASTGTVALWKSRMDPLEVQAMGRRGWEVYCKRRREGWSYSFSVKDDYQYDAVPVGDFLFNLEPLGVVSRPSMTSCLVIRQEYGFLWPSQIPVDVREFLVMLYLGERREAWKWFVDFLIRISKEGLRVQNKNSKEATGCS